MTMKPSRPNGQRRLILISFLFVAFLCFLASINEVRYNTLSKLSGCAFSSATTFQLQNSTWENNLIIPNPSPHEIRILLGVLTLPSKYDRRHFLRLVYGTQPVVGAKIDLKFVFCNITQEDQRVMIALEIMRYDDIIILNCNENMDMGKTYTYFSSLPSMLNSKDQPYPPYHYVMKVDDDVYFRLENLVESLRPLPREDLYYGFVLPCPSMNPFHEYMAGMGYLVSWDIVEWIRDDRIPKLNWRGTEDRVFGSWMREGHRGKNRFNAKWSMYDYPEKKTRCTHELWPNTTGVHQLKKMEHFLNVLNYFNATQNLKPSKLYHIP